MVDAANKGVFVARLSSMLAPTPVRLVSGIRGLWRPLSFRNVCSCMHAFCYLESAGTF